MSESPNASGSTISRWRVDDMPDLTGRCAVVTGGNSGLGYEAALQLARRGARLILACRNAEKAEAATRSIYEDCADAKTEAMDLDLASLESIRCFSKRLLDRSPRLDLLINNAGVMALPYRRTADGFEMQLGTNHLGHFALTGLLLPRLLETPGARVVTVSSTMHKIGKIRFDDLQWERGYKKWGAYGQSKLANLLFAYELQRRLTTAGASLLSVACHPGYAATNLQITGPRMEGSSFMERASELANRAFSQSAAMGALPSLYAATSPEVEGGDYIGPEGFAEVHGHPKKVESNKRSHDSVAAAQLWEISEALTGVHYEALA
jgi:NAD(P)-dependent dehydrogenase (short-subunit alcohol dehydrogenase family)